MHKNNRLGSIYLIYSSQQAKTKTNDTPSAPENIWGQFELFASEKPDAVIIAQPDKLGLEGITKIIASGHARRIFDLREMPFISFGNETREDFLDVLEQNKVEYFNIFKLKQKICKKEAHIDANKITIFSIENCDFKKMLQPMIASGPTVVFSDVEPVADQSVKKLLDFLTISAIKYSPVFAERNME